MRLYGDPHGLVGHEVPAADGRDYGHRVVAYDAAADRFVVRAIRWSTGEEMAEELQPGSIDAFKITYRYDLARRRPAGAPPPQAGTPAPKKRGRPKG